MKLPSLSLSKLKTKRGISLAVIAVLILGLFVYGGASYLGNSSPAYNNASGVNTVPSKSTLKTTNANAASAGTIAVPCGCKKQTTGQPSQNSTNGTTFQGGSSDPTGTTGCNPCPVDGSSGAVSSTMICPEYMCKAPTPTPVPVPTPTPTPTPPHCAPCGGFREGATTSAGYACPMLCME